MKFSLVLNSLALIAPALCAPLVIEYDTEIVYVTAPAVVVTEAPTTEAPTSTPSPTPTPTPEVSSTSSSVVQPVSSSANNHVHKGAKVSHVVVSKLVEVEGSITRTHVTTYTTEENVETTTVAPVTTVAVQAVQEALSEAEPTTTLIVSPTPEPVVESTTSTTPEPTPTPEPTTSAPQVEVVTVTPTPEPETTTSAEPVVVTSTTSSANTVEATTQSTSSSTLSEFQSSILNTHNNYRAKHGAVALQWSDKLAQFAQDYADKYDCSGVLTHSGGEYGENLGVGYTTVGVVDAWYEEVSYYEPSSPQASHFTQVIWAGSTELGCAYKQCGSYWGQYTICSYNPAGNVLTQFSQNVLNV